MLFTLGYCFYSSSCNNSDPLLLPPFLFQGATTENSKWEGITFSPKRNKMYTAISDVRRGMEDNKSGGKNDTKYDIGGPNDIRLPVNNCGCVYEMDVVDNDIKTMKGFICGIPVTGDAKNTCKMDGIANPDNVAMSDELNTLLIGEDTGTGHQNDVLWAYSFADGSMTRILSTPYGAETTSPYWYKIEALEALSANVDRLESSGAGVVDGAGSSEDLGELEIFNHGRKLSLVCRAKRNPGNVKSTTIDITLLVQFSSVKSTRGEVICLVGDKFEETSALSVIGVVSSFACKI